MKLVGLIDEDFVNYKQPCMVLEFPYCSFKCDKECGQPVCQNSKLATASIIEISIDNIIERYLENPITKAICCQGLEPLDSQYDLEQLLIRLNEYYGCKDPVIIYTGYNEDEIDIDYWYQFYDYLIMKFGRYIPNQKPHYDDVLGIYLASDNQYAKRIR